MATLQKYTFDLDFDKVPPLSAEGEDGDIVIYGSEPEIAAEMIMEEEPLPPPPMFSEEDLALAREQAYESGRATGMQEAEAATERMLAATLNTINAHLQGLGAIQEAANDAMLRDATAVALAVVRKILPETARLHGLEEIEGVIRECLSHLDRDVRVTIRINPALVDGIREHAQRAADATAFEGKLVFTADPRVNLGDCRVEWGGGGAERDQARIWAEIEAVVLRALDVPATAADQQNETETASPETQL